MPSARTLSKPKTQDRIKPLDALARATIGHLTRSPGLELPRLQRKLGFTPDRQFREGAPSTNAGNAIKRLVKAGVIRIEAPTAIYPIPRAFLCTDRHVLPDRLLEAL